LANQIVTGLKSGDTEFRNEIPETLISPEVFNKLTKKPDDTEDAEEERRESSLEDFRLILEDILDVLFDDNMTDKAQEIDELIEDGHVILSALLLDDTVKVVSGFEGETSTTISRSKLAKLLGEVKDYCEITNTLQFPPEWVQLVSEIETSELIPIYEEDTPDISETVLTSDDDLKRQSEKLDKKPVTNRTPVKPLPKIPTGKNLPKTKYSELDLNVDPSPSKKNRKKCAKEKFTDTGLPNHNEQRPRVPDSSPKTAP